MLKAQQLESIQNTIMTRMRELEMQYKALQEEYNKHNSDLVAVRAEITELRLKEAETKSKSEERREEVVKKANKKTK